MPIKPEKRKLYSPDWNKISAYIRARAGNRCELCYAKNGALHWKTGSLVVLTVHHINGDPTDNRRLNLLALCQRCHNRLDQPFRRPARIAGTGLLLVGPGATTSTGRR